MNKLDDIKSKSDAKEKVAQVAKVEKAKVIVKEKYVEEIKDITDNSYILGFIDYSQNQSKHRDMKYMHLLLGCVAFDLIVHNEIVGIDYDNTKTIHASKINSKSQSNYFILASNSYINIIFLALFSHYTRLTNETSNGSQSNIFMELVSLDNKKVLVIPDIIESVETFGYRFIDIVLTIASVGYNVDIESFDEIHVLDINNIRYSVEIYTSLESLQYMPISAHSSSTDVDEANSQVTIELQDHCIDCALYDICKVDKILKIK